MHTPVQHYRGYDILCSASGYTLLRNDVEVLTVGTRDAGSHLQDCARLNRLLEKARQSVDELIDGD
ncbi:MAG TPA: hypothetical protein VM621_09535 [Luteibacter sp.]|uniref:hypothetical protein n=1 Tax=Luteibacter sp. TaxID=1886636 RepID=UPI002C5D6A33|nr:hypothetical protein [Luteibacter sp.]HVI55282.1 hypothetical protein [Luteibacter sp.]